MPSWSHLCLLRIHSTRVRLHAQVKAVTSCLSPGHGRIVRCFFYHKHMQNRSLPLWTLGTAILSHAFKCICSTISALYGIFPTLFYGEHNAVGHFLSEAWEPPSWKRHHLALIGWWRRKPHPLMHTPMNLSFRVLVYRMHVTYDSFESTMPYMVYFLHFYTVRYLELFTDIYKKVKK